MPERDANQLAADATTARRGIISALIAVKGHLDQPYPDDDRWTPWTRFVEPALQRLDESVKELVGLVGTLQQERDSERRWCKHWAERAEAAEAALTNMTGWHNEAQARVNELEATLATTRQALRDGVRVAAQYMDTGRGDLDGWIAQAEALAGPGSEQSSLTESGSAGLPDTPADSQPSGWVCDREDCQGRPADKESCDG